jgi:hypothetical protein
MANGYTLARGDGRSATEMLNELADLYVEVHQEPAYEGGPLYKGEAFLTRTRNQIEREGFTITWAQGRDRSLLGFSFGLPLGEGRWWTGNGSSPPDEVLSSVKVRRHRANRP